MIPRFSVRNPVLVNMLMLLAIVGGILATLNITLEAFPLVDFEVITIRTTYPGASPSEIEKLVTIPIEDEIADLDEIEDMTSSSIEGMSIIGLQLKAGVDDIDKTLVDVQNRVNRAKLPEIVDDPIVEKMENSYAVINLAVYGSTRYEILKENAEALRELLLDLKPDGVSAVELDGIRDREIWVETDPDRLYYHGLTFSHVIDRLRNRNLNLPGGTIKESAEETLVRTIGEFESAREIEEVVLLSNNRGHIVPVSEVATVTDTYEDPVTLGHVNAHRSINLRVEKRKEGNTILLVDRIREIVSDFRTRADPNVNIAVTNDRSEMIRARVNVMITNGVMGFGLVIILLYLFLGDRVRWITIVSIALLTGTAVLGIQTFQANLTVTMGLTGLYGILVLGIMSLDPSGRISLMTAVGIPISILFAIILMDAYGATLNMISMFGLIVVLGMLVDDGIVVTENVYRHLQLGKSKVEAAIQGAQEVFWPVTCAILTTVAAFMPLLLVHGIMGKFMMWIPIVVIFALLGSLLESFLVLPSHLADFGVPKGATPGREKGWFRGLRGFYTWVLARSLRYRYALLGCGVLLFAGAMWFGMTQLGFQLFPRRAMDRFTVNIKAPVGTKIEDTEGIIQEVEQKALTLSEEERESVLGRIGTVGSREDREIGTNVGSVTVGLVDIDQRARDGEEIIADFRKMLPRREGLTIEFQRGRHGPPTGSAIQVRIRGEDPAALAALSVDMMTFLEKIDGVKDVKTDIETGKSEEHVIIDEEEARALGVDVRRIAEAVRFAYQGGVATRIRRGSEDIDVIVRLPRKHRESTVGLSNLYVVRDTGQLVPLENVATLQRRRGPSRINRFNAKRSVTVTADVEPLVTSSFEVNSRLRGQFADRAGAGTALTFGGEEGERVKGMKSLLQAFWISLLLIYMILGTLFRSFIQPLVVMFTVPFGFIGVIYGLFVHGQPLSLMALIGTVALTGVVVNDSLVLVEFVNRLRREGLPRNKAIMEGARLRLRPIILTTITTVVGLLPLTLGIAGSSAFLSPMAIAMVWGLSFATILTLILIPCLYAIVDDAWRFVSGRDSVAKG